VRTLPPDVQVYHRTPEFDQHTIPAGLLREHTTKAGVWGRIVVLEGRLAFRSAARQLDVVLDGSRPGVVEPEVSHEVAPLGPVRFYVEFLK
jgi:tellurite resistance-related uncharacterized protein